FAVSMETKMLPALMHTLSRGGQLMPLIRDERKANTGNNVLVSCEPQEFWEETSLQKNRIVNVLSAV
ncbi:hypothetical protein Bpfe_029553, partial [Biomphalaria pfeifferi]